MRCPSVSYVDQYIPVDDRYRELRYLHIEVEVVHAGAAIVPSPMPRAHQQIALQDALPERPSAARADAVERVNLAVQIAQRVAVFANGDFGCRAWGKRRYRQHFDERHFSFPPASPRDRSPASRPVLSEVRAGGPAVSAQP